MGFRKKEKIESVSVSITFAGFLPGLHQVEKKEKIQENVFFIFHMSV